MTLVTPDIADIRAAASRIKPHAHRTPVLTCSTIDEMAGRSVSFKCENFQKVGAFKFRGAMNAVLQLSDDEVKRGAVTHSSGNHAQALALAAKMRGIQAHIVMPSNSSAPKRRGVEGYGGIVHECAPTLEARETTAQRVLEETGGVFVPPYDHPHIIAGQGTCALEFLEESRGFDAIVAPIGGGGLMSGTCLAAHGINPELRVFGAEPSGADDAARSLQAGHFVPQESPNTIADGLLTSMGELTWPIIRDHVEHVFTVDDEQIMHAMRLVWERMKIVIEPSAAVAVAVVLSDEFRAVEDIERVGVILSGGNVDLDRLPWVVNI